MNPTKLLSYILKTFIIPLILIITVLEIAKYRGYIIIHFVCTHPHHHYEEEENDSEQEISTQIKKSNINFRWY
ncbi:MAG: hypothetical protein H8E60_01750 [Candidatus Marinimicrobia bacterium]|nr:hypothetical protein [Candidatus Neomarinimicrobiota bacterium]